MNEYKKKLEALLLALARVERERVEAHLSQASAYENAFIEAHDVLTRLTPGPGVAALVELHNGAARQLDWPDSVARYVAGEVSVGYLAKHTNRNIADFSSLSNVVGKLYAEISALRKYGTRKNDKDQKV